MGLSNNASRTYNASPNVHNSRVSTSKMKERKSNHQRTETPNENCIPVSIGSSNFAHKNLLNKTE